MFAVPEPYQPGYRRPGFVVEKALRLGHDRRWEAGLLVACHRQPHLRPVPILLLDSIDDRATVLTWPEKFRSDVARGPTESIVLRHPPSARGAVPKTVGGMTHGRA